MLKRINFWLILFTVIVTGLSAGAMLGEQKTLVPFWLELSPNEFFLWYSKNASRLSGFFAPLQILSTILAVMLAISSKIENRTGSAWFIASAFFAIAVLATFFMYFKNANAGFLENQFSVGELSNALASWSAWQWGRISFGVLTFCSALLGALSSKR